MYNTLATFCASAGVIVFLSSLFSKNKLLQAIPLGLEFFLASGLLKLLGTPSWSALATAALIIIVRKVAGSTLPRL